MPQDLAVVIPVFNAENWIGRTIDSVLAQNAGALVIAVDDGSTDGSVARVTEYGSDVVLLTGPNRGACHARNRGLAEARDRGVRYVLFLDADDYHEGALLAGSHAEAEAHDADIVLSDMHLEYLDGRRDLRPRYTGRVSPLEFFRGWMEGDYVNPSAILWKADFVAGIGGWDESLARAQDIELTLRAMLHDPVIVKNEAGAAIHARVNPGSISRSQSRKALDSRFRAVSGLVEKAKGTRFEEVIPLLHRELYHISRAAFKAGFSDLGRAGTELLSRAGYRDHPGTMAHRIAAGVLGLERKVRLWKG